MEKLSQIALQKSVQVVKVDGQGPLLRRLVALGLRPGAEISVVRRAPLGDPMVVRVQGTTLSIRHSVADGVLVRG
ncbi:MAG: ferrous iron transport protein A [Candidatus Eremiobacteraeota bacterium]|nr:ferrous iron transport protein A [Candidatus Eremiobacteraeota bacterium]